jgi:AcrR family transcriptional regulator
MTNRSQSEMKAKSSVPTSTWFRLDDAKRQRVLQAAMQEFGEHGYSTGSLNTIAREAEIAKGSLFQYFADKQEFFAHVCDEASRRIRTDMEGRIATLDLDQSFTDWLTEVCFAWSEYFADHPLERSVTAATNLEIDNVVRAVVRATAELHYVEVIRPLIQMWRDRDAIRPDADDDVLLSLLLILLPHLALAPYYDGLDAVFGLRGRTPEEQRPIIRRILSGLSPVFQPVTS